MLTKEDPIFQKISDALDFLSQNRELTEQCIRMREAAAEKAYIRQELAKTEAALAEKDAELAEMDAALAEMDIALAEKGAALAERDSELKQLRALLDKKQE